MHVFMVLLFAFVTPSAALTVLAGDEAVGKEPFRYHDATRRPALTENQRPPFKSKNEGTGSDFTDYEPFGTISWQQTSVQGRMHHASSVMSITDEDYAADVIVSWLVTLLLVGIGGFALYSAFKQTSAENAAVKRSPRRLAPLAQPAKPLFYFKS